MKAATKRGVARTTRALDPAPPREMDPAVCEAAKAVMEAMAGFLLAVAKASAPQGPPLVASPFDARQTRRLVEAGKLNAIKVGREWYGRPADFEALLSTVDAPLPANDHDLRSGADRIVQDELARRGLRLRKTAPPSALPTPPGSRAPCEITTAARAPSSPPLGIKTANRSKPGRELPPSASTSSPSAPSASTSTALRLPLPSSRAPLACLLRAKRNHIRPAVSPCPSFRISSFPIVS